MEDGESKRNGSNEEEEEENENVTVAVVGYALESKKVDTFLRPSLLSFAKLRGIHFVSVDLQVPSPSPSPLPFHCLIHKLYGPDWHRQLLHFQTQHPDLLIIDSPDSILRLHDRVSMLQSLPVPTPNQLLLLDHLSPDPPPLHFPVIAKPVSAKGGAASHEMALVFHAHALKKLHTPVVLQEFVNHGGLLFKVYVAGNHVRCVQRPSLPDLNLGDTQGGIMPFSQISNLAAPAAALPTQMPPQELVNRFATDLRHELKLNLFNFDLIRDSNTNSFLVIDINYFPGYAKLPGFEAFITDFFLDITRSST